MSSGCVQVLWRECLASNRLDGILEKESHDVWPLRKWQTRLFKLDLEKKTLTYLEGEEEMRGEYSLTPSSYLAFVHIRPTRDNCELVVSGYSRGSWSYLYLAASDEETANMWFAALRRVIRGESFEVGGISTWISTLKSFTEHTYQTMSEYVTQGIDLSISEAAHARLNSDCISLIRNYTRAFQSMQSALLSEYQGTDIELSTLQIDSIQTILYCFQQMQSLKCFNSVCSLESEEVSILKRFQMIMKNIPPSLTTIYLRQYESGRGAPQSALMSLGGEAGNRSSTRVAITTQRNGILSIDQVKISPELNEGYKGEKSYWWL